MISTLITDAIGEDVILLDRMPYVNYLVQFRKKSKEMTKALIDFGNEVNAMILAC